MCHHGRRCHRTNERTGEGLRRSCGIPRGHSISLAIRLQRMPFVLKVSPCPRGDSLDIFRAADYCMAAREALLRADMEAATHPGPLYRPATVRRIALTQTSPTSINAIHCMLLVGHKSIYRTTANMATRTSTAHKHRVCTSAYITDTHIPRSAQRRTL